MRGSEKRTAGMAIALSAAMALSSGVIVAQGRRAASPGPQYDLKNEVTLQVTVTEVKRIPGPGAQAGIHLAVDSTEGPLEIDLGPEWFLKDRKYVLAAGDRLTVTGARIRRADRDALIAREIKKGTETMTLRDAKGLPLWAGRGRG